MREKTWKTVALALLISPALLTLGCSSDGDKVSSQAPVVALAEPVQIISSKSGDSKALTLGVKLIKTQADYDALGDADINPGVDFENNDLVVVSLGEQSTGGYAVQITGIQLEGDELAVTGKSTRPGPDAVTTQVLTYPYDSVVIPNTSAAVAVPYID